MLCAAVAQQFAGGSLVDDGNALASALRACELENSIKTKSTPEFFSMSSLPPGVFIKEWQAKHLAAV
jgi:hypothetical protein